jgi:hypothetical protein
LRILNQIQLGLPWKYLPAEIAAESIGFSPAEINLQLNCSSATAQPQRIRRSVKLFTGKLTSSDQEVMTLRTIRDCLQHAVGELLSERVVW